MKNILNELEDQLQEIIENNKQIKAISAILNESWDGLLNINQKDPEGHIKHYEFNRIAERNETLFWMLIRLSNDIDEKNSKVLDEITKIGRELV